MTASASSLATTNWLAELAYSTVPFNDIGKIFCSGCWKMYDSVHHLPKIFSTCLHTVCAQCICDESNGRSFLICPSRLAKTPCQPIAIADSSCQTLVNEVNRLMTNFPALISSLIFRIKRNCATCDGPFCCENDHSQGPCNKPAVSLFKPKNLVVCQHCFAYGLHRGCFNSATNQPLSDLRVTNPEWLKFHLRDNRKAFADCPLHIDQYISSYCRTCHMGVCKLCLPNHVCSIGQDGNIIQHNIKQFDDAVMKNESDFLNAYCKLMENNMKVLDILCLKIGALMDSDGLASNAERVPIRGLDNHLIEMTLMKKDFSILTMYVREALLFCSAQELSIVRHWIRNRAYHLHIRTNELDEFWRPILRGGAITYLTIPTQASPSSISESDYASKMTTPVASPNRISFSSNQRNRTARSSTPKRTCPSREHSIVIYSSESLNSFHPPSPMPKANLTNSLRLTPGSSVSMEPIVEEQRPASESGIGGWEGDCEAFFSENAEISFHEDGAVGILMTPMKRRSNSDLDIHNNDREREPCASDNNANDTVPLAMSKPLKFRHRLYFMLKIGQAGDKPGDFSEAQGMVTDNSNYLIVCDANNHRLEKFQLLSGSFVCVFGDEAFGGLPPNEALKFPARIAINRVTGHFYITERPPSASVAVLDRNYRFVRRFANGELLHAREICVDDDGYVLVLQGIVMTVSIFTPEGEMIRAFNLLSTSDETSMSFPTAMCVSEGEIFITCNTKHSIFVYDYEGNLKRVSRPGVDILSYPIGIAINHRGQIVVLDNHETFNITLFDRDFNFVRGYQSQVKHSGVNHCGLINNGRSVGMSCKDYKVYIYQYETESGEIQPPRRIRRPRSHLNPYGKLKSSTIAVTEPYLNKGKESKKGLRLASNINC